jgi:DNA-binding response OmpR family regulator
MEKRMAIGQGIMRSWPVVLVVEDNERVRKAEAEALTSRGYDVHTATSTEEALSLLSSARVDLLITDMRLPGEMDGVALARRARAQWPDVKIVIVGVDVDQFAPADLPAVADEVLKKPFRLSEFEERVASLVG